VTFQTVPTFTPGPSDSFTLFNNAAGTNNNAGAWVDYPEGLQFLLNGNEVTLTYVGGTGNDVLLLLADTQATIENGDLVITDIGGAAGDTDDTLTIKADVANSQYIITDPNNVVVPNGITGATRPDQHTAVIPFSAVTGKLIFNTLAGTDSLTIDFSLGNFPHEVVFNGGDPTTGTGDRLTLTGGGTFTNATFNYTNASNGSIDITGPSTGSGEAQTITYAGLEPITADITAATVTLNYGPTAETITVSSGGAGKTTAASTAGETTTFNNPTTALVINAGDAGGDTVNVTGLGAGFAADLTIAGPSGPYTVTFQTNFTDLGGGSLLVNAETINVNAAVSTSGTGTITLTAGDEVAVTAPITTVNGALTLTATDDITATNTGILTTTSGLVTLTAGGTLGYVGNINAGSGGLVVSLVDTDGLLSGIISGSGDFTKNGAGTLTLSGANTYGGATLINAGTLRLGAAAVIPDGTAVTVAAGATFDLNDNDETIGSLAGAGNLDLGAATLTTGGDNTSTTFSGIFSGAGNLVKTGTGSFELSGANTYAGTTTVSAGTLKVSHATGLGSTAGGTIVQSGATLELNDVLGGVEDTTLSGDGVGGLGALISSGTSTLMGAMTLAAAVTISGTGSLTLNTITGAHDLTITGSLHTLLKGAVTGLNSLNIANTVQMDGSTIATTGAQTYQGAVTLGTNTTLTGSTVTFNDTVTGNTYALVITGNADFDAAVSGLQSLSVSGTTQLDGGSIISTGTQTYQGAVSLGADTTLTASDLTFNGTVDGSYNLALISSGTTALLGVVGDTTPLASLTTDAAGTTIITGGSITSTGDQNYGDALILGANTTLNANNVTFAATVDSTSGNNYDLVVNTSSNGVTTFRGNVGSTDRLASITTNADGQTELDADIYLNGNTATFFDPVILRSNVNIDEVGSGAVTFNGSVTGSGYDLTINAATTTFGNGATDTVTGVGTLTTDAAGTTTINTDTISGDVLTFNDAVVLGTSPTLTGTTSVTFNGTVAGATFDLTINSPTTTFGDEDADTVTGIGTLITDAAGTTTINTDTVSGDIWRYVYKINRHN